MYAKILEKDHTIINNPEPLEFGQKIIKCITIFIIHMKFKIYTCVFSFEDYTTSKINKKIKHNISIKLYIF